MNTPSRAFRSGLRNTKTFNQHEGEGLKRSNYHPIFPRSRSLPRFFDNMTKEEDHEEWFMNHSEEWCKGYFEGVIDCINLLKDKGCHK